MPMMVVMPKLGEAFESGTVAKWYVQVGDIVGKHQALGEVETDKATLEIEATDDGMVARILALEGAEVRVGAPFIELTPPRAFAEKTVALYYP